MHLVIVVLLLEHIIPRTNRAITSNSLLFDASDRVPRGGTEHLYPDAVSNVAHAYAHLSHDKEAEDEHHVLPVKSTSTKKVPSSKEEVDYHVEDFEDPFFQALLHNNDADSGVVNVKSASKQRVDEELFSKLDEKISRRHRGEVSEEERKEEVDGKKVTYGLREFLEDSTLIE